MPTIKQVFTLPTKAQWVEIARRVAVTFGSAFSASLAVNEAGITNLHTAEIVGVAAATAGLNALYRVFVTPAVAEAKVEGSLALSALSTEVQGALAGARPVSLSSVLAVLPADALLKVLQAQSQSDPYLGATLQSVPFAGVPITFTGDASQVVPPPA